VWMLVELEHVATGWSHYGADTLGLPNDREARAAGQLIRSQPTELVECQGCADREGRGVVSVWPPFECRLKAGAAARGEDSVFATDQALGGSRRSGQRKRS